jgi:hypothetical protein
MRKSITSKRKAWELLNSGWILWTILTFGTLNFVSFFYIAYKVKQKKWTLWGLLYSIPFILLMTVGETVSSEHWLHNIITLLHLVMWPISIFHAFRIRAEYLVRLEMYQSVKKRDMEQLRKEIASEYGGMSSPKSLVPVKQPELDDHEHVAPIDLNAATEQELAAVPPLGIILAKKALAKREELGGFYSIDHFGEELGLKPHVLERVRPYVKVDSKVEQVMEEDATGRIVDF